MWSCSWRSRRRRRIKMCHRASWLPASVPGEMESENGKFQIQKTGQANIQKKLDRRKGALVFLEICSYCFLFWVLLTLLHWYSVCRATWQCKYLPSVFPTYTHRSPITWTLCFQTYSPWWDIDLLYLLMTREILGKRQSAPFYEWSLWPCDIKYSV